jgi:hypothetical protein
LSSTADVGDGDVLQYSRDPGGILPLPSPPQPNTFPSANNASVWSRPQLIDAMEWRSVAAGFIAGG